MAEREQGTRYSSHTDSNSQQQHSGLAPQPNGFTDQPPSFQQSNAQPTGFSSGSDLRPSTEIQGVPIQPLFQLDDQLQTSAASGMPLTLSRGEKQRYDQIFRMWAPRGEGFIAGQMARELFAQSGLDKTDLAKIWWVHCACGVMITFLTTIHLHPCSRALADGDNRGKLNLSEFHVAMGLIYRSTPSTPCSVRLVCSLSVTCRT